VGKSRVSGGSSPPKLFSLFAIFFSGGDEDQKPLLAEAPGAATAFFHLRGGLLGDSRSPQFPQIRGGPPGCFFPPKWGKLFDEWGTLGPLVKKSFLYGRDLGGVLHPLFFSSRPPFLAGGSWGEGRHFWLWRGGGFFGEILFPGEIGVPHRKGSLPLWEGFTISFELSAPGRFFVPWGSLVS